MNLLYITNGINKSAGLERVLSIKASALADTPGYQVTIVVLNNGHVEPFYPFSSAIRFLPVRVQGNPLAYFSAYVKGMQAAIDEVNPDVILVCDDGLKGMMLPSLVRTTAKWVYERHVSKLVEYKQEDPFHKRMMAQLKWKAMALFGKRFDRFVVLTQGNLSEWPSLKNLQVIGNPLSFYPEQSADLSQKRILVVGRHAYQKGYDYLLSIWEPLSKKYPDWQVDVYGASCPRLAYAQQAKQRKIENIAFLDPVQSIQSEYLKSSIYLMTSRYEGFGMVLIEAMACGVPCISFDCNYGPSDIIQDGVDGYLVPTFDLELFRTRLEKLMQEQALREAMGKKAKENVARFDTVHVVAEWKKLFTELKSH